MTLYRLARPALFRVDAETTHDRVMRSLGFVSSHPVALRPLEWLCRFEDGRLAVTLFGAKLPNPLAVAAGLDKNGVAVPAFTALGFGYVEVGTVTPQQQTGNPRPRLFRLPEDRGLINRMGFPGAGMGQVARNLERAPSRSALNVGPNRDRVEHTAEDALAVIRHFAGHQPLYVAVNVSSPNTAGLRDLQAGGALRSLLRDVQEGIRFLPAAPPLVVKLSPDLSDAELDDAIGIILDLGIEGVIATNTSVARPAVLRSNRKAETGGLSGSPLREMSTRCVARIYNMAGERLVIIGVGGVFDGADVLDKIGAGATIVQLYTGLIYEGPDVAKRIKEQMGAILAKEGIEGLESIRGTGYRAPRA